EELRARLAEFSARPGSTPELHPAQLGPHGRLLGAAEAAFDSFIAALDSARKQPQGTPIPPIRRTAPPPQQDWWQRRTGYSGLVHLHRESRSTAPAPRCSGREGAEPAARNDPGRHVAAHSGAFGRGGPAVTRTPVTTALTMSRLTRKLTRGKTLPRIPRPPPAPTTPSAIPDSSGV